MLHTQRGYLNSRSLNSDLQSKVEATKHSPGVNQKKN